MARLLCGDSSHIDGAAQVWAEATAFREGDPDVAPLEGSRPIIARVMDRPRSVLIVALDDPTPHRRTGKPEQRYRHTLGGQAAGR